MLNDLDAFTRGVCANCEKNVMGELTALDAQKYKMTTLCPECWADHVCSLPKNEKAPVQMGLPLIGDAPKIIEMGPVSLGTLITTHSYLLRNCIIECQYRGPISYFRVISPNQDVSKGLINFLRGATKKEKTQ